MSGFDAAAALADEHVVWARVYGLTPGDVLRGIGWPVPVAAGWGEVRHALMVEWERLPVRRKGRRRAPRVIPDDIDLLRGQPGSFA